MRSFSPVIGTNVCICGWTIDDMETYLNRKLVESGGAFPSSTIPLLSLEKPISIKLRIDNRFNHGKIIAKVCNIPKYLVKLRDKCEQGIKLGEFIEKFLYVQAFCEQEEDEKYQHVDMGVMTHIVIMEAFSSGKWHISYRWNPLLKMWDIKAYDMSNDYEDRFHIDIESSLKRTLTELVLAHLNIGFKDLSYMMNDRQDLIWELVKMHKNPGYEMDLKKFMLFLTCLGFSYDINPKVYNGLVNGKFSINRQHVRIVEMDAETADDEPEDVILDRTDEVIELLKTRQEESVENLDYYEYPEDGNVKIRLPKDNINDGREEKATLETSEIEESEPEEDKIMVDDLLLRIDSDVLKFLRSFKVQTINDVVSKINEYRSYFTKNKVWYNIPVVKNHGCSKKVANEFEILLHEIYPDADFKYYFNSNVKFKGKYAGLLDKIKSGDIEIEDGYTFGNLTVLSKAFHVNDNELVYKCALSNNKKEEIILKKYSQLLYEQKSFLGEE